MIEVVQGTLHEWVEAGADVSHLLEIFARMPHVTIPAPCGGRGRCGKCVVTVVGAPPPPSTADRRFLSETELAAGRRLSCTCPASGVVRVELPAATATAFTKAELPQFDSPVAVFVEALEAGRTALAVDIGTTTVAAYRVSTDDGRVERVTAEVNRQALFGSDVLSRISYCDEHRDGLEQLTGAIRTQLSRMWRVLGLEHGLVVVTGNTTMIHLLAGESPASIGRAPFTPRFLELRRYDGRELGLPHGARVILLPSNAAYVGADIMSAAVAAGIDRETRPTLLVDIGTNGELVLAHGGSVLTCSTAAGPAFEGASISCGVGGVAGAISAWQRAGDDFRFDTIAAAEPVGLCGPGLLDVVATLLEDGVVDESGRMAEAGGWTASRPPHATPDDSAAEPHDAWRGRITEIDDQPAVQLTGSVSFTQRDVREVQLAKAAVAAGIETLCRRAGIAIGAIERIVLTGGFGGHLRIGSARRIGLLPALPAERFEVVDNAAGRGAVGVIRDGTTLARIERLAREARSIELSGDGYFQERFVEQMLFPEPEGVA